MLSTMFGSTSLKTRIREKIQFALRKYRIGILERKHQRGHKKYPVERYEFDAWVPEQSWRNDDVDFSTVQMR